MSNDLFSLDTILILSYIKAFPGRYGYKIAHHCGLNPQGIYVLINRLERRGLITIEGKELGTTARKSLKITELGLNELQKVVPKIIRIQVFIGRNLEVSKQS